jgi:hypothetical protein
LVRDCGSGGGKEAAAQLRRPLRRFREAVWQTLLRTGIITQPVASDNDQKPEKRIALQSKAP